MAEESKGNGSGSSGGGGSGGRSDLPRYHAAYGESAMRSDAVMLNTLNEMLQSVERQYRAGRMRAFAEHNDSVMADFAQVRQLQEQLFKKHLDLEVKLINKEKKHRSADTGRSNNFCDHLQQLFQEAAPGVQALNADMSTLADRLADINLKVPDATKEMAKRAAREHASATSSSSHRRSGDRSRRSRRTHARAAGASSSAVPAAGVPLAPSATR